MRALHPNRMENYLWSSLNPMALYTQMAARNAKQERVSIAEDNIFLDWERLLGNALVNGLNAYRDIRDQTIEATLHAMYDKHYARALVGIDPLSETQKLP